MAALYDPDAYPELGAWARLALEQELAQQQEQQQQAWQMQPQRWVAGETTCMHAQVWKPLPRE